MAALCIRYWRLAMLWVLSLLTVGAVSSSAQSQGRVGQPRQNPNQITVAPEIVFGNDVGFRIVRPVEEYENLKGIKSKVTKQSD